jgi:ABC-2 type transport system permease protein
MNLFVYQGNTELRFYFDAVSKLVFIFCPILAMRSFSEEKREGTFLLLKTSPVSMLEIVIGKYLGVLSVFFAYLLLSTIFFVSVSPYTDLYLPEIFVQYLGLFLLGATVISIGLVFSAATENQIVAAVGGLFFSLILLFISSLIESNSGVLRELFKELTIITHYNSFLDGLLELKNIVYFCLLITISLFITLRFSDS